MTPDFEVKDFEFRGALVRAGDWSNNVVFLLNDVCSALGIGNPRMAKRRLLPEHCITVRAADGKRGNPYQNAVTEAGLYELIMRSTRPEARDFRRWVTEEVLPSIRQTGSYKADPVYLPPETPAPFKVDVNDLPQIQEFARQLLVQNFQLKDELSATSLNLRATSLAVAYLEPKAQAFERIASTSGNMCVRDAAKVLQVQPKQLTWFLAQQKWIYRRKAKGDWKVFDDKREAGLVVQRAVEFQMGDGRRVTRGQVRITSKGLAKLAEAYGVKLTQMELFPH